MLAGFTRVQASDTIEEVEEDRRDRPEAKAPLSVLGVNMSWLLIVIGATILTGFAARLVVHLSASPGLLFGRAPAGNDGQIDTAPLPSPSSRVPPSLSARLSVQGVLFEWNGRSPVFLSGINQPWLSYGHDFGRDRGAAHYCQMRQVLLNASRAGANSVRVFLHGHSTYTPEFDSSGFVISPDGKQTLLDDLRRYLRGAQQLGLLVTLVLWDAAALSNTSGEYALFGSVPKLTSYIDNVLTPMVQALADEPALASWDILNEPEGSVLVGAADANPCFDTTLLSGTGAGWEQAADRGGGPPILMRQVLRFIGMQAAAIHAANPRALVTVGAWSEVSISSSTGGKGFNYYTKECLAGATLGEAQGAAANAGGGDGVNATRSAGAGGAGLPMQGACLDYYQVHSYAPSSKPFGSTQPFSKRAGGFGLSVPLIVGEFSGGVHSGGLTPTEQYQRLFETGYAGAWGWSATNLGFYDGIRELRDEAAVAVVELPSAADVTSCPGQWPWEGGGSESATGTATGRRRASAAQSDGSLLLLNDEEWTAPEYLQRKLARRDGGAVRPDNRNHIPTEH